MRTSPQTLSTKTRVQMVDDLLGYFKDLVHDTGQAVADGQPDDNLEAELQKVGKDIQDLIGSILDR